VRSRLLVIPAVDDINLFAQLMAHLGHYFGHIGCERIVVPVNAGLVSDAAEWLESPTLPPGFDERVVDRVAEVRHSVELRAWPSNLEPPVFTSDVILDWDVRRSTSEPWASLRSKYRRHKTLFEVDWCGTRLGASWFAEAAKVLGHGRAFHHEGADLLEDVLKECEVSENAFLVGTGPSVRQALDLDLSRGLRIACNTVVLDRELMDHIRPHILCFADPIFHFGPSTYAHQFQRSVVEQARRHNFTIVTTERFAALFRAHVPELAERVIGLRQGTSRWPDNLDLLRQPSVRPYPNVLTMLMLPLATSVARSIGLIGFDGRTASDTSFWTHGPTVQLDREMSQIRDVHPGFFDLDYEDYYKDHLVQLEAMIRRIEVRGIEIRPLTRSHMPPLRRRTSSQITVPTETAVSSRPRLVSLTPDWIDDFGHFGPFERRIHDVAADAGFDHLAFASAGLEPVSEWEVPAFTDPLTGEAVVSSKFEVQLRTALKAAALGPGSVVMLYGGDVWYLPSVLEVARHHPTTRFIVNLMRSHEWIASALQEPNPWARGLAGLLKVCLAAAHETNVEVTVDTGALGRDVELLTGHSLDTWPMVALGSSSSQQTSQAHAGERPIHVLSPVYAQKRKGFGDVVGLSEQLKTRSELNEVRLSARSAPQPLGFPPDIDQLLNDFLDNGGDLIQGHLSDAGYADLMASADVVLVPYRTRPFRTRTSGVVLDALLGGKPVVTVRGTWAGDLVESYEAGATYEEGDIEQLVTAISDVISDLNVLSERVRGLRETVAAEFSPERLIEFMIQRPQLQSGAPSIDDVRAVTERAELLRDLHRSREQARESSKVDVAVARDDRERSVDIRQDQIDSLERSIVWHRAQVDRSKRPKTAPPLEQRIYPRTAKARLDEVEMAAYLVDPDRRAAGHMVDVGAHHGSAFTHFLRRGWAITAFEPDVRHFEYLVHVYGADERVSLDKRAVTDTSGVVRPLYTSEESTGVSALAPFLDSHIVADSVETVSLREALDARHVDVLKVDTEGFDLSVLNGYPWDRDSPDVIVCEFENRKTSPLGYSTTDLGDFLVAKGYQVWMSEWHPVTRYGIQHEWHRLSAYPCEPSSPEAWGNFLAFKQPRAENTLARALAACLHVENPDARTDMADQSRPLGASGGEKQGRDPADPGPRLRSHNKESRQGDGLTTPSMKRVRAEAIARSLRGSLAPVLGTALLFAGIAATLAVFNQERLALVAGAAGIATSVLGTVVVAIRLERRTRR